MCNISDGKIVEKYHRENIISQRVKSVVMMVIYAFAITITTFFIVLLMGLK